MEEKNYIVGVDIGSSAITMAVGVKGEENISVIGVKAQPIDEGYVKNGDIQNYVEVGKAIIAAKEYLEKEYKVNLSSSYVGLSGKSVYCVRYEDYVDITSSNGCVTEAEISGLKRRIEMAIPGGGDTIIDRIALRYRVDERNDVKSPLGTFGQKLYATYLLVMVSNQQSKLVSEAMNYAGLKVCGLCVNPAILHDLLLTDREREDGVAIVDIGSEVTDIAVVKDNKLCYFSSLPIGASSINNDLRSFLMIPKKDIDLLKRKYGSATADGVDADNMVTIISSHKVKKRVLQRNLAEIIQERLKDIAHFIHRELKVSQFATKLPCGIVLTGGSAYLANIDELFSRELNMEVRLGRMLNGFDANSQEEVSAFNQGAALALLLYGSKHEKCMVRTTNTPLSASPRTVVSPPRVTPGNGGTYTPPTQTPQPTPPTTPTQTPPTQTPQEKIQSPDSTKTTQPSDVNNGGKNDAPTSTDKGGDKGGKKLTPEPPKKPSFGDRLRNLLGNVFNNDDEYL